MNTFCKRSEKRRSLKHLKHLKRISIYGVSSYHVTGTVWGPIYTLYHLILTINLGGTFYPPVICEEIEAQRSKGTEQITSGKRIRKPCYISLQNSVLSLHHACLLPAIICKSSSLEKIVKYWKIKRCLCYSFFFFSFFFK